METTLNRKQKIDFLKAAIKGEVSFSELLFGSGTKVIEDIPERPGYFQEMVSGRIFSLADVRKMFAEKKIAGPWIICCDIDL